MMLPSLPNSTVSRCLSVSYWIVSSMAFLSSTIPEFLVAHLQMLSFEDRVYFSLDVMDEFFVELYSC